MPPAQGLYDPANEHDACGLGFVASIRGEKSHSIVEKGIEVLTHLEHRGACGCDPETGDGAGVLIQIPHEFFARECATLGMALPEPGGYAVGMVFLPVGKLERLQCEGVVEKIIQEEGFEVMGWRDTPVDPTAIGRVARGSQPYIEQIFLKTLQPLAEADFERKLYVIRRRIENEIAHAEIEGKQPLLHPFALLSHHCLQGPAAGSADHQVLSRAERSAGEKRALPGSPALLHQHLPELASGASLIATSPTTAKSIP